MDNDATTEAERRLHLPRILCLHGGGTNCRIFRAQLRVLERMLIPYFRLCYAQAPFTSPQPGPDVLSVYEKFGPFRAWLRWSPDDPAGDTNGVAEEIITSVERAMREDDLAGADGPFVGLLGFSQGAKVCASILRAQQSRRDHHHWQNFLFAVLIAGRAPLIQLEPIDHDDCRENEDLLDVPTVHVHGLNDPNLHLHRRLLHDHFKPSSTSLMEWDGDHRIPLKTKDVTRLVAEILAAFGRSVPQQETGRYLQTTRSLQNVRAVI